MAKTYGFGVIGCGAISPTHCEAIKLLPNARLVAVMDIVEAAARRKADDWDCEAYTDLDGLLARDDIDVVNVVVPSGLHAEIGKQAAAAGKHVICTKPIDISLEAIDGLIVACRQAGVKLGATHQFRSFPSFRRLKAALTEGRLGRILCANAFVPWRRPREYYAGSWHGTKALDGGGALINQSIHYIDQLVWQVGDVAEVAGFTEHLVHDIEGEDCGSAAVRFRSGAQGLLQGTTCTYKGQPSRFEVHGEKGNVTIVGDHVQLWDVDGEEVEYNADPGSGAAGAVTASSDPRQGMVGLAVQAHVEQIGDVLRAIEEDREPELNGIEARRAVELILAIYRANDEGRVVELPLKPAP